MSNDEAQKVAIECGLLCGVPGARFKNGERVFSLKGKTQATVIGMHGGNIVVNTDDGEQQALAYYEIGVRHNAELCGGTSATNAVLNGEL